MLDEDAEVKKVYEDGRRPYEDMRKKGGIDFSQVAGQKTVLGRKS